MSWATYSTQLCDHSEGYQGILCGVCSRGFGQTAPFKCNRCIGFDPLVVHDHNDDSFTAAVPQPGPVRISGLYFVYWLVLTCWLLLCVRFSAEAPKHTPNSGPAQTMIQECQVAQSRKDTSNTVSAPHQQQQQQLGAAHSVFVQDMACAASQPKKHRSKSLDITKVRAG
jgi:hypothetical protein